MEETSTDRNEEIAALKAAAAANAAALAAGATDVPSEVRDFNARIDAEVSGDFEFGGKLARQIGADLSGDRYEKERKDSSDDREEAMQQAARPQDWKAKLATMDHEARVNATLECLGRKNNQKEILSDLLAFCRQERTEQEAEAFLEAHKQFSDGYHSADKYLLFMKRAGGIEELEFDSEGVLITEAMREELRGLGAPEEEMEDLACEWHFRTTEAGEEALRRFDPAERSRKLLCDEPSSRMDSYARLLEFCEQPRSLEEITAFMADDPGLEVDPSTGVMRMQPSAYIGKLDQSGALTWEDGWKTTQGGKEALQTLSGKALEERDL